MNGEVCVQLNNMNANDGDNANDGSASACGSWGGGIEKFDGKDWETYLERLEIQFIVKKVKDEDKASALLGCLSPKVYKKLRSLLHPAKPITQSFDTITAKLEEFYSPKPQVSTARFKFFNRFQGERESMKEFMAALRQLAANCDFKESLDEQLTDRFICGMRHGPIQQQLMCEKRDKLTAQKAEETAVNMETAERDSSKFQQHAGAAAKQVDKMKAHAAPRRNNNAARRNNQSEQPRTCFCCGKPGHTKAICRFKDSKCHVCGRPGHLKSVCRQVKSGNNKSYKKKNVHEIDEDENDDNESEWNVGWMGTTNEVQCQEVVKENDDDEEEDYMFVGSIEKVVDNDEQDEVIIDADHEDVHMVTVPPIWLDVKIDGTSVDMELDTGAAVSILPYNMYKQTFSHLTLYSTRVKLRSYGNKIIKPEGELRTTVEYQGQVVDAVCYVVKTSNPPLFGRSWLKLIKLNWSEIKTVHFTKPAQLESLLQEYEEVYSSDMGKLIGIKAKLHVKETTPKFRQARAVPYAIRPKVEREIERLQDLGVISPVDSSDTHCF